MSTELPFEVLAWQPRPRSHLVTVVTKATFVLEPGELELAEAQEPIVREDAFLNNDPGRSLLWASEVVPSKPRCDVVVTGHAYANDDRGAQHVVARLLIEPIDKRIEVLGDRAVGPDGTVYQGPRFHRIPLIYERTAGGPGTWNPVGVRSTSRDAYGRAPLPNLVPAGKAGETSTLAEPIGFGPICATWKQRADKLGFHTFGPNGWAGEPIPEGFDLGYFNCAPPDQQIDHIPEDATIVIEHLHPHHDKLSATLPGIRPQVTVQRRGGQERPMMRPDTLWIDTERRLVLVTWRGHFTLEHEAEQFRVTVQAERPPPSWRTVEHALSPSTGARPARQTIAEIPASAKTWSASPPGPGAGETRASARTTDPKKGATVALPFRSLAPDPRTGALPFGGSSPTRAMPAAPAASTGLPFGSGAASVPPPPGPPAAPAPSAAVPAAPTPPPPAPPVPPARAPLPTSPISGASFAGPAPAPLRPAGVEDWARPAAAVPIAPPAPVLPTHGSAAALGGLVSASNAAADPRLAGQAAGGRRAIEGDVLQVVWHSPDVLVRVRRKPEWKKILDKIDLVRFDPDVDHPDMAGDPAMLEEQREIFAVLSKGSPGAQSAVDSALLDALRQDGRFAPQLLLLAGELRFDFDEIENLKATVTSARPFTENDEPLKKAVDAASAFFKNAESASPDVATAMTGRVREAFQNANRPVAASFLDEQTERVLLEKRALQKREVFGAPHARGMLFFSGGGSGVPTYLPWPVAQKLPLFRRLRVRMLVEAHFQADQYESHTAALKVVALARVVR